MYPKVRYACMSYALLLVACFYIYICLRLVADVFYTERVTSQHYAVPGQTESYVTGNDSKGSNWMFTILNSHRYVVNNSKTYHVIDRVVYSTDYEEPMTKVDPGNGTSKLGKSVANRYRLEQVIGKCHFGEVYLGSNVHTGEPVAVKVQHQWRRHAYLGDEHSIYSAIQGGVGIPKVMWHGREGSSAVLVMELLGASLEERFVTHSRNFSLKIVLLLAESLINRFEYIHSKGYVYRDVKPHHFLTGLGNKENIIYVIDFGLSKRFRDAKTHEHIPYLTNKSFVGSLKYASVNAQLGLQQTRRDDMESLGYLLMYFLRGTLPWFGLRYETMKEEHASTLDKKMAISMEALCQGCPLEFLLYIRICRSMRFDAKPDYPRLRQLFRNVSNRYNFTSDQTFGWKGNTTVGRDEQRSAITSVSPLIRQWLDKE